MAEPSPVPRERLDAEWLELLNEIRVLLPGVQVLFAFLLAVPFASGFDEVTELCRRAGDDFHLAAVYINRQTLWMRLCEPERAIADLRAARALVYEEAEAVWATASEGAPFTLEQRAHARATGAWATDQAASAAAMAYRFGGGSSLYADSPLQRRLRDINAITQHFLVKPDTLTTAGAILAGQDVQLMVF